MPRRSFRRPSAPRAAPSVWEVDIATVEISHDGKPAGTAGLMVIVANLKILVNEVVSPPSGDMGERADLFAARIRQAINESQSTPAVIHVRGDAVALFLGLNLLPLGIEVRDAPLPLIDRAFAVYDDVLNGRPLEGGKSKLIKRPESWFGWGLDENQIARFFAAAAAYYRAAPWRFVTEDDIARVTILLGGAWSTSVMGHSGDGAGLALYSNHVDLVDLIERDTPPPDLTHVAGSVISLAFNRFAELPDGMKNEIRTAGWEMADPLAYPDLLTIKSPSGGLTPRDMEDLIETLTAVREFVRKNQRVLSGRETLDSRISWSDATGGVSIVFERR